MLCAIVLLAQMVCAYNKAGFAVTSIPDVPFAVESYAGLLPVSQNPSEIRKLFFWYFPSSNTSSLTIFLNGGPGCSSLEGALQENGPVMYRKGMLKPEGNPYSWTNHTSMLYVEQPIGTGFSQGVADAQNETVIATHFQGFLQEFREVFADVQERDLYIAGESYAGKYIGYIADRLLQEQANPFHLKGVMLIDPVLSSTALQQYVPAAAFMQRNKVILGLEEDTMNHIQQTADDCGFSDLLHSHIATSTSIGANDLSNFPFKSSGACADIWQRLYGECRKKNPNFNIYKITDSSLPVDPLGFPASDPHLPPGGVLYFNRSDVQKALHAPPTNWATCSTSPVFPNGDASPDVTETVLPHLIERLERVVIVHGLLDMVLIEEGTRLALQSMVFNNARGFTKGSMKPFRVPQKGQTGFYVQERGLTYVQLKLAGHQVPEDDGESSIKLLRYMLGMTELN